jgi:small subunit ribosomal protein S3
LQEDLKIRRSIRNMYPEAGVSQVEIDRQANNVTLTIHTARPGILIGRGGQRVDEMRNKLEKLVGKKVQLNIREVQQPELDAFLVARSVADQMERRIAYRRAMKQSMQRTIQAGAKGMRIRCAGRLDGAEIARKVIMHEGRVPLHTIRADVDYGFTEARTVMGRIGVKVWVYKGDILPEKEEAEMAEAAPVAAPAPVDEAKPAAEVAVAPAAAEAVAAAAPPAIEPATPVATAVPAPATPTAEVEKPKVVRRAPRPRTTPAGETAAPATAPAGDAAASPTAATTAAAAAAEAPRPARRIAPRPKPVTAEPVKAAGAGSEEKPKAPVARRPRVAAKPRDAATPETPVQSADKQGEGNATT